MLTQKYHTLLLLINIIIWYICYKSKLVFDFPDGELHSVSVSYQFLQ